MAVLEKENLWLQKTQQESKYPRILIKTSKAKLDWNYPKNKRRLCNENSFDDSLLFKKAKARKSRQVTSSHSRSVSKQTNIEATFLELVNQWREETRGISSTNQMSMHPAYQQIIGMGEAAIPLLLRELERKSGQWFWALKSITREDPVPPEHRGKTREMIRAWLDWGKHRGYKW